MAISTYTELKSAVANWLARAGDSNITDNAADFIMLAERRINRSLRLRAMEDRATATVSTEYVALPTGFLEMRNFQLNTNPITRLEPMSPEQIDTIWAGSTTGRPRVYCILNDEIQLRPAPDADYTAEMAYWKAFDALSDTATSNWLLANAPDLYLWGALAEATPFIGDVEAGPLWEARFQAAVKALQDSDDRGKWSGATPRIRTDGGNP